MRLCLICGEIFAWGKYGGFGRATRKIGGELLRRGIEVTAIVPRRGDQGPCESLDGMTVLGFRPHDLGEAYRLYRDCDADIYHSQEPSLGTWLAMRARPDRKHVITFRDTRDRHDWAVELDLPSRSRWATHLTRFYEYNPLVNWAARHADACFCAARCVGVKARAVYGLAAIPEHLPTPIDIPGEVSKAATPTVCFVGRLDRRKRPELFLDLPRRFPHVAFVVAGAAQDPAWDAELRQRCAGQSNLTLAGFVDQFDSPDLHALYSRSWVLVNTSAREGLPTTFLEALAHGCAVLSEVDPDGVASRFGARVERGDFAAALEGLLAGEHWRARGRLGRQFVADHFATPLAVDRHGEVYGRVLST